MDAFESEHLIYVTYSNPNAQIQISDMHMRLISKSDMMFHFKYFAGYINIMLTLPNLYLTWIMYKINYYFEELTQILAQPRTAGIGDSPVISEKLFFFIDLTLPNDVIIR
ncbi:hypothetical protein ACJX0J_019762 [Zea mays]